MKYLLDTDTVIYFLNGNESVQARFRAVGIDTLHVSAVTIAELYFGAFNSSKVDANIERIMVFSALVRVLDYDRESAKFFGLTKKQLKGSGKTIDDIDLLIASVALSNQMVLVTNNQKHFRRISGLRLENWLQ